MLSIKALPCWLQIVTIFNTLASISTAAKLGVMHFFSEKIPGYALASTFVALGGILNGYVLRATVLSSDTFRPLSFNLVSNLSVWMFCDKAAFFLSITRSDSTSTDDAFTYLV